MTWGELTKAIGYTADWREREPQPVHRAPLTERQKKCCHRWNADYVCEGCGVTKEAAFFTGERIELPETQILLLRKS